MANPTSFPGDIDVPGVATLRGGISPAIARTALLQENLSEFTLPLTIWRTWDAMGTPLPSAAGTDDLGLVGGTFGSASPSIQAGDLKAEAGNPTLRYARAQIPLPMNYVAGETVVLRFRAGMLTTIADDACTLDVEAYKSNGETGIGSDLYAGAALTINSLVFANKDFTLTPTTLSPGDMLDVRITVSTSDGATGTAVIPCIGEAQLLVDTKG